MHNLKEIQSIVFSLPLEDLVRFRQWFLARDANAWDMQVKSDVEAGKLDFLAAEALEEYRTGNVCPL